MNCRLLIVTLNLGALDFVLTSIRILENCGLQVTVKAVVAFRMVAYISQVLEVKNSYGYVGGIGSLYLWALLVINIYADINNK